METSIAMGRTILAGFPGCPNGCGGSRHRVCSVRQKHKQSRAAARYAIPHHLRRRHPMTQVLPEAEAGRVPRDGAAAIATAGLACGVLFFAVVVLAIVAHPRIEAPVLAFIV